MTGRAVKVTLLAGTCLWRGEDDQKACKPKTCTCGLPVARPVGGAAVLTLSMHKVEVFYT